jgi:glycine cleavage system H protein
MPEGSFEYNRCAFSTRLYTNRLYTASHSWLSRQAERVWQVGFTRFAIRVLGEPVELDFEVDPGTQVDAGQVIGWLEGFKAVTDLFCPMAGRFAGANPELSDRVSLIQSDPFGRGWLYTVEGTPGDDCFDVYGYASFLDATIARMTGRPYEPRQASNG